MKHSHNVLLLAGASVCALASSPSFAQGAPAQSAQSSQGNDTIVVTARRREESLQDVPGSVTAIGAASLETFSADEIGDIQSTVPNLTLHEGDAQNTVAYIRGVGQLDSLAFADPGVGIYLDDVYLGRAQGSFLDVFDLERIEVLRGPQGTLYGRNTIGGAIKFVSRKPTTTPTFNASATYGNFDRIELKAGASGPIIGDSVLGKASIGYFSRDGYATNNFDGQDDGGKDTLAWRASLLATPSERWEFELTTDGSRDTPDTSRTPARETNVFGAADPNPDPFQIDANFNDLSDLDVWGVSGRASYDVSDSLTLMSITSYREMGYDAHLDLDATEFDFFGVFVFEDQNQFSQELQLTYEGDSLAVVGGLYYFEEEDITESGIFGPAIAFISNSVNDQKTTAYAAFLDGTYDLNDKLSISAGIRLTKEEKDFARVQEFFADDTPLVPAIGEGARVTDVDVSEDFDNVSPRASISYEFSPDLTAYASFSRGFKSGGFDGRSNSDREALPFEAETLTAYEAGVKGRFWGGIGTGSLAVFYNDYQDLQVSSFTADDTGAFAAIFTNAAEAEIFGVEAEASIRAADNLRFDLTLGYLDASYGTFIGENGDNVADQLTPANSPKWTGRFGAEYRAQISSDTEFVMAAAASYRSAVFPTVSSSTILRQEGYALVDASMGLEFADGKYSLRVAGRNLTDEVYRTQGFDLSDSLGYQLGYYGAPRTVSVTAAVNF